MSSFVEEETDGDHVEMTRPKQAAGPGRGSRACEPGAEELTAEPDEQLLGEGPQPQCPSLLQGAG